MKLSATAANKFSPELIKLARQINVQSGSSAIPTDNPQIKKLSQEELATLNEILVALHANPDDETIASISNSNLSEPANEKSGKLNKSSLDTSVPDNTANSQAEFKPEVSAADKYNKKEVLNGIGNSKASLIQVAVNNNTSSDQAKSKVIKTGTDYVVEVLDKASPKLAKAFNSFSDPKNKYLKMSGTWLNILTAGTNLAVQGFESVSKDDVTKDKLHKLSSGIYRGFLFQNSNLGWVMAAKQNKFLSTFGNLLDVPFAFLPEKWIYAARRLYAGAAVTDAAIDKSSKSSQHPRNTKEKAYESFGVSAKVALERIVEFPQEMFKDFKRILSEKDTDVKTKLKKLWHESLYSDSKATMGMIGGLSSFASVGAHLVGKEKLGKVLGDFMGVGAFCMDRLHPDNLKKGRLYYWLSGLFFAMGGASDITGNTKMQMATDALAKMATQEYKRTRELQSESESIAMPWQNPAKFISQVSTRLKDSFSPEASPAPA